MSYFSRLTDIVTCNISDLLSEESDPGKALDQIIFEMEEGIAGAKRSIQTAGRSEERLRNDLAGQRKLMGDWQEQARAALEAGREDEARQLLRRKQEISAVVAGLEQEHAAAAATREHLTTTLRALEARYAEAQRKRAELGETTEGGRGGMSRSIPSPLDQQPDAEVEAELEMLKRELGQ